LRSNSDYCDSVQDGADDGGSDAESSSDVGGDALHAAAGLLAARVAQNVAGLLTAVHAQPTGERNTRIGVGSTRTIGSEIAETWLAGIFAELVQIARIAQVDGRLLPSVELLAARALLGARRFDFGP
jgi:hypothetical protein